MTTIEWSLPWLSLMCVSPLFIDFNIYLDSVKDALFWHFPPVLRYKIGRVLKQSCITQFFVNNLFLAFPRRIFLGRRSARVNKKNLSAQSEVVFFNPSAFTETSFALPGCIRPVSSSSRARAVPIKSERVERKGRGWRGSLSCKLVLCLGTQILNFHSRAFLRLFSW